MWQHLYLVFGLLILESECSKWNYREQNKWPETCLVGHRQSPINFDENTAVEKSFEKFVFEYYHIDLKGSLIYNGHNVILQVSNSSTRPKIYGGGLNKEYVFEHLHFHWGSEHTINGYRYPLEVHLVHIASEYGNFDNAAKHDDGISVLGALYDFSPDNDVLIQPFIKAAEHVKKSPDVLENMDQIDLSSFLPRDVAGFYRYNGSLTTPNCSESVIWTVFSNAVPISDVQVRFFKSLNAMWEKDEKENFRNLQDLNGRTVYRKVSPVRKCNSSKSYLYVSTTTGLAMLMVTVFVTFVRC